MIQPSQQKFKDELDKYNAKATVLVHSKETRKAVLSMLKGKDPVQRVANATVTVMQRIDDAARKSGVEVQDTVKIFGAHEIVEMIIEFGSAAKIFTMDKDLAELALSVSVQDYINSEVKAGRIHAQKLNVALQADIRKLPPKTRKEMQMSQTRIAQTAKKYNHGAGMTPQGA